MARVHNFNAGPAALPLPALERAREELLDFANSGMSVMEHSHRGKEYEAVHNEAIALLRSLLGVPANYQVLFLTGGASQQFAQVPMNFLPAGAEAEYVITGGWSEKAVEEANRVGKAREVANVKTEKGLFPRIPAQGELTLSKEAAYVHVTSNNTLEGTQFHYDVETPGTPLVADMSSDFLWKKFDITKYAMVYAGAQKNLGPSGVTLAIIRDDLLAKARTDIPVIFRYGTHAKNNSLYNTPPTFAIYMVRNVLAWLSDQGGLDAVEKRNRAKGDALYAAIDAKSEFYKCPVEKGSRSYMNVVWRLPSEELEDKFVSAAKKQGLVGLKGHRSVGGLRASIYNAVSLESVQALVSFMGEFASANGG